MFTFSHITSIGVSKEEYDRRVAAGEKNLVKGENKFYREVATQVTAPSSREEFAAMVLADKSEETIKCGDEKCKVNESLKHYLVGLKLAVNQKVQAAERDGGVEWREVLMKIVKSNPQAISDVTSIEFKALSLLNGKAASAKIFVEKFLEENPDFMA